jgi:hypothetical protein
MKIYFILSLIILIWYVNTNIIFFINLVKLSTTLLYLAGSVSCNEKYSNFCIFESCAVGLSFRLLAQVKHISIPII